MEVILPKRAPEKLKKRVNRVVEQIKAGQVIFRKTRKYGYKTLVIGDDERAVVIDGAIHFFHQHRQYEKFINQCH